MKTKNLIASLVLLIGILSLNLVSPFAVSSRYWEDNPLIASPGESVEFFVVLQNIAGEGGDMTVEGSITEGSDIATFKDSSPIYSVPFGQKVNVYLEAEIPREASNGEILNVVVSFRTISGDSSQALGLGSGIERTIPIKIVSSEKSNMWIWILGLAIVVVVITLLIARKRNN